MFVILELDAAVMLMGGMGGCTAVQLLLPHLVMQKMSDEGGNRDFSASLIYCPQ